MNDSIRKRRNNIKESLVHAKKSGEEVVIKTPIREGVVSETVKFYNQEGLFKGGGIFLTTAFVFEDMNGRSIDLIKEYSPKGTFFVRVFYNKEVLKALNGLGEQKEIFFYQDFKSKEIGIKGFVFYNRIKNIGDLLILLHEIGHSLNSGKFYKNDEGLILIMSREDAHKKNRINPEKGEVLIMYKDDDGQRVPTPVPRDEYLIFQIDRSRDERTAWAYALKSLRKIRRIGVLFEPKLIHTSDFRELIHDCSLWGYEDRMKKETSLSPEEYKKLQGIFSRKF